MQTYLLPVILPVIKYLLVVIRLMVEAC